MRAQLCGSGARNDNATYRTGGGRFPARCESSKVLPAREGPPSTYGVRSSERSVAKDEGARAQVAGESAPSAAPEPVPPWLTVHLRLMELGAERAQHEHELGRWLREAERLAVHRELGYGSFGEYADRVLGLGPRKLKERLKIARSLVDLPLLDKALGSGALPWSTVRELTRVATPETEADWQRWAKGTRSREVEQGVSGRRPGAAPGARPEPGLVKHLLRFEVRAETLALFRELQSKVRAALGGEADDDMVLYELARRALGGPTDEGRSSYQVAVTRCPDCRRTFIEAGGESHEVDAAFAEMVECDCQNLGRVDGAGANAGVGAGAGVPEPAARPEPAGEPLEKTHVGELAGNTPRAKPARATQTVPPAVRRAVLRREHKRCEVPGCTNSVFLDIHHGVAREEGGGHDEDALHVVCGAHHRATHVGALAMQGTAATGFRFFHADGTPYGQKPDPRIAILAEQVFSALRHHGFTH